MYPIKPTKNDIICGQDKKLANHPGNQTFRNEIIKYASEYENATKPNKMRLTQKIVTSLKNDNNSRFLCFNREIFAWEIISDQRARDKVSHALRFAHQTRERISTTLIEAAASRMNRSSKGTAIKKTKFISTALVCSHKHRLKLLPHNMDADVLNESNALDNIDCGFSTSTKDISVLNHDETDIIFQRQQELLKNLKLSDCDNAKWSFNEKVVSTTPEVLHPTQYYDNPGWLYNNRNDRSINTDPQPFHASIHDSSNEKIQSNFILNKFLERDICYHDKEVLCCKKDSPTCNCHFQSTLFSTIPRSPDGPQKASSVEGVIESNTNLELMDPEANVDEISLEWLSCLLEQD